MVSVEQAVKDFNRWLANQHAHQGRTGVAFNQNFANIAGMINEFRLAYYRSLTASEIPEVKEIEAAVRKAWGLKASATRQKRAIREASKKASREEKEKQYVLPF